MTVGQLCRKWHCKTNNTTTLSSSLSPPFKTFSLRGCAKTHFGFAVLTAPLDVDKWPAAEVYTVVITKEMMHLTPLSDYSPTLAWPHSLGVEPNAFLSFFLSPYQSLYVWKAVLYKPSGVFPVSSHKLCCIRCSCKCLVCFETILLDFDARICLTCLLQVFL